MYCPWCGKLMSDTGTNFSCAHGSGLSTHVSRILRERYDPAKREIPQSQTPGYNRQLHSDRWYCPGCGAHMNKMECLSCGRHLRDLVRSLVEFHFHEV